MLKSRSQTNPGLGVLSDLLVLDRVSTHKRYPGDPVMVYKDKDEAAIRWTAQPHYYSESDKRILTIIHQAQLYVTTKGHSLANKVGYLEECLNSIKDAVKLQRRYEEEK
jgi:hypothetical protein